jgi:hypothetical protein
VAQWQHASSAPLGGSFFTLQHYKSSFLIPMGDLLTFLLKEEIKELALKFTIIVFEKKLYLTCYAPAVQSQPLEFPVNVQFPPFLLLD